LSELTTKYRNLCFPRVSVELFPLTFNHLTPFPKRKNHLSLANLDSERSSWRTKTIMPTHMSALSRPPSRELIPRPPLERCLSIEQTYQLADSARRKTSSELSRRDLRVMIAHSSVLEMLLQDIALSEEEAKTSPPTSPRQSASRPHISWADASPQKIDVKKDVEEFEDDGAEDLESLSLVRTVTRGRH